MNIDLEKSIRLFVTRSYYERSQSCSEMVRDLKLLYGKLITPDIIQYAVKIYVNYNAFYGGSKNE
ncbi:MAG: hypothetical protein E7505_04565 [Ruminococcus sp.]|nr:hypothetical protein [Ruminococcus sp.]